MAEHWRRYSHRKSVVFKQVEGHWFCLRYSSEALKRAMLAVGTRGYVSIIGEGHPARVGWREACIRIRNFEFVNNE
jgi:hypothetical protein